MKSKTLFCSALATFLFGVAPLHAAETALNPKAQKTTKTQVFQSMAGYRNTIIFYTFEAEKAVLFVEIDNKSNKFPIAAKLHVFTKEATAEGLKNWINNQHSDGLFPDVPEPILSHIIPVASCSVLSKIMAEVFKDEHFGSFNRYNVEFKIENVPAFGDFKIKEFTDNASVYIKIDGEG